MILTSLISFPGFADSYRIDGEFTGCDFDKYYPIGGFDLLVKCEGYKEFFSFMPEVITHEGEVITIDNIAIEATLLEGSSIKTYISDEFDGCDVKKKYKFDNELMFECSSYSYSYSFKPKVLILTPDFKMPIVYIDGEEYKGILIY
jgi:hypothetical protein